MKPRLTDGQSIFMDLARGLSALAVLLGHTLSYLPNPPALGTFYPIQSFGVVVFFVLSGSLICISTLSKKDYGYGAYLIDRFSRVYVALVPTLLLILIMDSLLGLAPPYGWDLKTVIANFTMLVGIPFGKAHFSLPYFEPLGTGRPLWTVSVEWWLYVAFGFLVFMTRLTFRSAIVMVLLTPIAFFTIYIFAARESLGLVWFISAALIIPVLRLNKEASALVGAPLFVFSSLLWLWKFLVLRTDVSVMNVYDPQLMYFSTAVIFSLIICIKAYAPLEVALTAIRGVSRWFADISYSLYLTHYTLLVGFAATFGMTWLKAIIFMTVAILFSWIFTVLFDRQYRTVARLLKRLLLRKSDSRERSLREQTQAAVAIEMSEEARRNAEDGVAPA